MTNFDRMLISMAIGVMLMFTVVMLFVKYDLVKLQSSVLCGEYSNGGSYGKTFRDSKADYFKYKPEQDKWSYQ